MFSSRHAKTKHGVIDIGSNSVRLVVYRGPTRAPIICFNEKAICGLGTGLADSGKLDERGVRSARKTLRRFAKILDQMRVTNITAIATAAVREASNGLEFVQAVERDCGIKIKIITGVEEARLGALGVFLGQPAARGLVCDMGGSSLQLSEVNDGTFLRGMTTSLGTLKLADIDEKGKPIKPVIKDIIDDLVSKFEASIGTRLYLVGGSWRAIAKLDMERRDYPLKVLQDYRMDVAQVQKTLNWYAKKIKEDLKDKSSVSDTRLDAMRYSGPVLSRLLKEFRPKEIVVSSYGIREGAIFDQWSQRDIDQDPLMAAALSLEKNFARNAGAGEEIYHFILPLFPNISMAKDRMLKVACHLHDIYWRIHPEYRSQLCFQNVLGLNLTNISHEDRITLAFTLMHRYKNKRPDIHLEPYLSRITSADYAWAERAGRALRFSSIFSVRRIFSAGELFYDPKNKIIKLNLTQHGTEIFTGSARVRFESLAKAFDVDGLTESP